MTLPYDAMPPAEPAADPAGGDAEDLLAWCDYGDRARLGAFLVRWQRPAYAVALRLTGDHSQAEDAVQQGFLNAMRRARQWHGKGSAGSWLLAVVANQARDLRRASDRRVSRQSPLSDVPARSHPKGDADLATVVRQAIDELPEHERLPLVLHHIDGLDQAVVAEVLGRNPGTVRMQLSRALERLQGILAARGVTAGAVLVALAAAIPAAEPPVGLVGRIATTVVGGPPAAAVISAWWVALAATLAITIGSVVAWRQLTSSAVLVPPQEIVPAPLAVAGEDTPPSKPMDWWIAAGWDPSGPWHEIPAPRAFLLASRLPATEQRGAGFTLRIGSLDKADALTEALTQVARARQESRPPKQQMFTTPVPDQGMTLAGLVAGQGLRGPTPDRGTLVILAGPGLNSGESLTPYRLQRDGVTFTLVLDEWRDNFPRSANVVSRNALAVALGDLPAGAYRLRVVIRHFFSSHWNAEGPNTYAPISIDHAELPFAVAAQAPPVVMTQEALQHSDSSILGELRSGRLQPDIMAFQVAAHLDRPDPASISASIGLLPDAGLSALMAGRESSPPTAERPPYPPNSFLVLHGPVGMVCTVRDLSLNDEGCLVARLDAWPRTSSEPADQATVLIPLLASMKRVTSAQVIWSLTTLDQDGTWCNGAMERHPAKVGVDGWDRLQTPITTPPPDSTPSPPPARF